MMLARSARSRLSQSGTFNIFKKKLSTLFFLIRIAISRKKTNSLGRRSLLAIFLRPRLTVYSSISQYVLFYFFSSQYLQHALLFFFLELFFFRRKMEDRISNSPSKISPDFEIPSVQLNSPLTHRVEDLIRFSYTSLQLHRQTSHTNQFPALSRPRLHPSETVRLPRSSELLSTSSSRTIFLLFLTLWKFPTVILVLFSKLLNIWEKRR